MTDTTLLPVQCPVCKMHFKDEATCDNHRARTHNPMPEGQLCELGCGQPAAYKNMFEGKTYFCSRDIRQCPSWVPLTPEYLPPAG